MYDWPAAIQLHGELVVLTMCLVLTPDYVIHDVLPGPS